LLPGRAQGCAIPLHTKAALPTRPVTGHDHAGTGSTDAKSANSAAATRKGQHHFRMIIGYTKGEVCGSCIRLIYRVRKRSKRNPLNVTNKLAPMPAKPTSAMTGPARPLSEHSSSPTLSRAHDDQLARYQVEFEIINVLDSIEPIANHQLFRRSV